jgi:hypothetical protein
MPLAFGGGLKEANLLKIEDPQSFDFDTDQVIAVCTSDFHENRSYLRPLAFRQSSGAWVSLDEPDVRQNLFYTSGDLISFPDGRENRGKIAKDEFGIWRVSKNRESDKVFLTNFHISGEKALAYEAFRVPFATTEFDSVRQFLKDHYSKHGLNVAKTHLFSLSDGFLVGARSGRDFSKDETFETPLLGWNSLEAIVYEGRFFVPGPLPAHEFQYECATLASSLRKLLVEDRTATEKMTKGQQKRLVELFVSGEAGLNQLRIKRLETEFNKVIQNSEALNLLIDEIMMNPQIKQQVESRIAAQVADVNGAKSELQTDIENLRLQRIGLVNKLKEAEEQGKNVGKQVARSIRTAFVKARDDSIATLGQASVFKAIMDNLVEQPALRPQPKADAANLSVKKMLPPRVREPDVTLKELATVFELIGIGRKSAKAIELVCRLAREQGFLLIVHGISANIVVESLLQQGAKVGRVLECDFGMTDESSIRQVWDDSSTPLAILDSNFSPIEVYAGSLIYEVQKSLLKITNTESRLTVVLTVSEDFAALPISEKVKSLSLQISVTDITHFIEQDDYDLKIAQMNDNQYSDVWFDSLWFPIKKGVIKALQQMAPSDAALALSALEFGIRP